MNEEVRLTIQVLISAGIIYGVIWWMWRIKGEPIVDSAAAPVLAFASVWAGLASVVVGGYLWFASAAACDWWVPIHVGVWSLAICFSGLSMWIYRQTPAEQMSEPIQLQRAQARIGLILGLVGVVLWYVFVLTHKAPLTPIGE